MKLSKLSACLCAVVMMVLLLPAFANNSTSSCPFTSVALAGHVQSGGAYCACGSSDDCICDAGELPNTARLNNGDLSDNKWPVSPESSGDGGVLLFGSLVLMALARFLWR